MLFATELHPDLNFGAIANAFGVQVSTDSFVVNFATPSRMPGHCSANTEYAWSAASLQASLPSWKGAARNTFPDPSSLLQPSVGVIVVVVVIVVLVMVVVVRVLVVIVEVAEVVSVVVPVDTAVDDAVVTGVVLSVVVAVVVAVDHSAVVVAEEVAVVVILVVISSHRSHVAGQ